MIDERKIRILQAIINDYISTGEPVGSRTIAKKYNLGVSSATIRNEMADLEEMGFLEQPHTSAGRVPSNKGYRLYVDRIMEYETLSLDEEMLIKKSIIDSAFCEADKVLKQASVLLSELTKLTCIVKPPVINKSFIKSIQLIMVDEKSMLCVLVTDNQVVKNQLIKIQKCPTIEGINHINKILNERLNNLTIEEINLEVINSLREDLKEYEDIFNALIPALYESLKQDKASSVFMEGTTNIFNYPEYNDIDKAKEILSLLYNTDSVSQLIDSNENLTIKIGDENFVPEAKGCSVISVSYHIGDRNLGTIGLIGPKRINYSKVLSIVTEVMKELNDSLKNR